MPGNAVVRHEPKANLVAGGNVAAIIPRTIEETFRLAGALSASGLAPNTLNSPEKVMVAIIAGAELGLPPFQAMQSFAVINGRPAIWGDGLIAVVRSNGFQVKEWIEGDGDQMIAYCEVVRPDNGELIRREFSVADAKKANLWGKAGPWQTTPKRMLQMRARGFACRDGAADVLRGFQLREEVEDYTPITNAGSPRPSGLAARLAGPQADDEGFNAARAEQAASEIEAHDPETGEVTDAVIHEPDAAQDAPHADDTFPGDKETAKADTPVSAHDSPAEWLVDARRWIADAPDLKTLTALDKDWKDTGRWLALQAHSGADHDQLLTDMEDRAGEIEAAAK